MDEPDELEGKNDDNDDDDDGSQKKKNKRLPEEISITSDMQVTPSLWQKEPFEESGRGE